LTSSFHPEAADGRRHVLVRDMVVECGIGVHDWEKASKQRVRINLDLTVTAGGQLPKSVSIETIMAGVRAIAQGRHTNLVETLAERIGAFCLEVDGVRVARIRVEKLDLFPDISSVGVEIERLGPV